MKGRPAARMRASLSASESSVITSYSIHYTKLYDSYASFERAVHDAGLLARLNLPFDSAEGFLFPETYLLPRNPENDARPVVEHMIKEFWKTAREVWPEGAPNGPELFRSYNFV